MILTHTTRIGIVRELCCGALRLRSGRKSSVRYQTLHYWVEAMGMHGVMRVVEGVSVLLGGVHCAVVSGGC